MRFQLCRKCRKYTVQESVQTARIRMRRNRREQNRWGKNNIFTDYVKSTYMFDVFLFSYLFFPFLGLRLSIGEDVEMLDFCLTREKKSVKMDGKVCDINGPTGDLDGTKSFARKTERCWLWASWIKIRR